MQTHHVAPVLCEDMGAAFDICPLQGQFVPPLEGFSFQRWADSGKWKYEASGCSIYKHTGVIADAYACIVQRFVQLVHERAAL